MGRTPNANAHGIGQAGAQPEFRETVLNLLEAAPQLGPVLDEHLADHDGDLLAYILLPDFARELDREWRSRTVSESCLENFAQAIENELAKNDADITNLIALGLLEEVGSSAGSPHLERYLGRRAKSELESMRNWSPEEPP